MPHHAARVLVVDDVADNRDLLSRRLRRLGIGHVAEAADGEAALALLAADSFDLVLLDIMMPGLDGFGVLERLRSQGRLHELPVVVISALNEMEAVVRCIGLGAEDFLTKPFDPVLLRARVTAVLEKQALRFAMQKELARKRVELADARALQLALLPRPLRVGALHASAALVPAREVGGDLVDMLGLADGRLLLAIGDVSDKGAGAAFFMARAHSVLRSLATRPDADALFDDPARAMAAANDALARDNEACMFVCLWLAVVVPGSGELRYVRAGAVPPWLRRADGSLLRLAEDGGPALGLLEGAPYVSSAAQLSAGDALLAVTDGITEAAAEDGPLFGDAGVETWLAATRAPSLADLLAIARAHERGAEPADDVAAVLLEHAP